MNKLAILGGEKIIKKKMNPHNSIGKEEIETEIDENTGEEIEEPINEDIDINELVIIPIEILKDGYNINIYG